MPTIFTHALVGGALTQAAPYGVSKLRFAIILIIVSVVADLDVVAFIFGIPYAHPFGHRGFFHSPAFALIFSFLICLIFLGEPRRFTPNWLVCYGLVFISGASHGLLDMATNGGLGIGILMPFDNHRYFFEFRPIKAAYISPVYFFKHPQTILVILTEIVWIWLPLILLTAIYQITKRKLRHNQLKINSLKNL